MPRHPRNQVRKQISASRVRLAMKILSFVRLATLASMAMASAALRTPAGAQGNTSVQLAFGYECGDRFLVRNDGTEPVALEWKTTGSPDRSQIHLNAKESREIASVSNDAVELWVAGKVVATEPKGNRPCAGNSGATAAPPSVVVRPLDANAGQPSGSGDPPSRVARLSYIQGGITFQPSGSTEWAVATLNNSVTTGDRLVSDQGGSAELQIGPVAARIAPSTDLTVTSLSDGLVQLGVPQGTTRLGVYRMNPGDTIEVDTPNGAVTVLAPGSYRISTDPSGAQTTVSVERGRAELTGPNLSQILEQGRTVRLTAEGNGIQVANVPKPGPDGFDAWSASRDAALSNPGSASVAYVNPDVPGVQDLDANGRWETDVAEGPVWYPTTVAVGWVPYRFGHWVWVEPWGWVWVDDAPWGFAPFHYGRWAYLRGRWGWVPGPRAMRPYYSPALVAFADGGGFGLSIGVSAWFPLGPRDPFFPWYHHDDFYLRAVNGANVRGVVNIGAFVNVADREHFPYAFRTRAMTVVPRTVFAGGRPIGHEVIRVAPERIALAPITPHPMVVPTREAALGGAIVERPAIAMDRRVVGVAVRPGAPRGAVAVGARPLVVRHAAPPADLPFETRQKAIAEHPGRPLEPQQLQNLRAGRPAGPQRDPEPPHPVRPPPARNEKKPN
jgi:hypothetical protein